MEKEALVSCNLFLKKVTNNYPLEGSCVIYPSTIPKEHSRSIPKPILLSLQLPLGTLLCNNIRTVWGKSVIKGSCCQNSQGNSDSPQVCKSTEGGSDEWLLICDVTMLLVRQQQGATSVHGEQGVRWSGILVFSGSPKKPPTTHKHKKCTLETISHALIVAEIWFKPSLTCWQRKKKLGVEKRRH